MRRLTTILRAMRGAIAAAALAAAPAVADPPEPLSVGDQMLVQQATGYLQDLNSVKGRFVQTDSRGNITQGELYMKRPGKARFAYDPPSGLLVVCDGRTVTVLDPRLNTINHYPLKYTPLALFLAREIRLDKGVVVTHVTHFSNGFGLTARDARHEAKGQITLTFATDPMRLTDWTMTDARGQTTRIQLSRLEPVGDLSDSLFEAQAPDDSIPPSP